MRASGRIGSIALDRREPWKRRDISRPGPKVREFETIIDLKCTSGTPSSVMLRGCAASRSFSL
jgi:hypothetical protein